MLTVAFSAYDLTSIRFAYSPLREVSTGIHALHTPAGRVPHLPRFKKVRPRLGDDLAPLLDLVPGGPYIPDFLCPVPASPPPDLAGPAVGAVLFQAGVLWWACAATGVLCAVFAFALMPAVARREQATARPVS
ncbi:hypothetical protein ABZ860_12665 [Microbispora sp. NPDC046973]|uniref:hypothetical protein n=1 Tax=Microbispora sp. NPDC046973 TaxID=3155022 RepID=UPI0033CB49D7